METVVFGELERRKTSVGYIKTESGYEVDFHAQFLDGREELIQVCAGFSSDHARERELRALTEAGKEYPNAAKRLLLLEQQQALEDVLVQPVYKWLLQQAP